jgi:hypothetical protein
MNVYFTYIGPYIPEGLDLVFIFTSLSERHIFSVKRYGRKISYDFNEISFIIILAHVTYLKQSNVSF